VLRVRRAQPYIFYTPGNKKEEGGFYIGTVTKLCDQQAKVIRDDGFETKQFYRLLIKIDG